MDQQEDKIPEASARLTLKAAGVIFLESMVAILALGGVVAVVYWLVLWVFNNAISALSQFYSSLSPLGQFVVVVVCIAVFVSLEVVGLLLSEQPPDPRKKKGAGEDKPRDSR